MFSIESFRSEVGKKGVLHGNRFLVTFTPPSAFSTIGGLNLLNNINEALPDNTENLQQLQMRAEAVSVPGMSFASADGLPPRFGYGPVEGIPYGVSFDPVNITFMMDGYGAVYKYFYNWANLIVNFKAKGQSMAAVNSETGAVPYQVAYKDEFVAPLMTVTVFESNHEPTKDEYVMKMNFYRAFPRNLSPFNLAWREQNEYVRFPVTFDYTDFDVVFNDHH